MEFLEKEDEEIKVFYPKQLADNIEKVSKRRGNPNWVKGMKK